MIKAIRHTAIILTGLSTFFSLIKSTNPVLLISLTILTAIWFFFSSKHTMIHGLMLPLYLFVIMLGFLFGNVIFMQIILFLLVLSTWEIDLLYIDSKGMIKKEDQWIMLKPLLIRELISMLVIGTSWFISSRIKLDLGFWFLSALVIILILILRKIFQFRKEDIQ